MLTYGGSVDIGEDVVAVRGGGMFESGVVGQGVTVCIL